jgi:polyribonucleotide nucleotidyltransferase
MDAGVPVKKPIAGIAMGMLLGDNDAVSDENALILSDILGTEDALGTMDFKVAGDRDGITAFQLDIKCEGLTVETMKRALQQAREGRLHLLDEMDKVLSQPRAELPPSVPKMSAFSIPPESIGKIIGPGGKQIRAIIDDFKLEAMDVEDDGSVQLTSYKTDKLAEAESFIRMLIGELSNPNGGGGGRKRQQNQQQAPSAGPKYAGPEAEEGKNYMGKITGIHPFGVFVEILPGAEDGSTPGLEGLCHVSELARDRVRNCEAFVRGMNSEQIEVKYLGVNERGQLRLSRKAVLEERDTGRPRMDSRRGADTAMTAEELDVIAKAIEGVTEL